MEITKDSGEPMVLKDESVKPQNISKILFENESVLEIIESKEVVRSKRSKVCLDLTTDET